jgi:hypothetical protein
VTTVASFDGTTTGGNPVGDLLQAKDGYLYGVTTYAPPSAGSGASGTVFRYDLSGTLTTLAIFNDPNVGTTPKVGLVEGNDGELYGTMSLHGLTGSFIYRVSKKGVVTPLAGTPPGQPVDNYFCNQPLSKDSAGTLYAMPTYLGLLLRLDDLDSTPDQFTFKSMVYASAGSSITSKAIVVTNISAAAPISVSAGASYSINGGAPTSLPGLVNKGDKVTVTVTAPARRTQTEYVTLDIGGTFGSFTVEAI